MRFRILLMDNNPDVLRKLGELLRLEGYEVVTASTIEAAEQILQEQWIHLAVLDIRMRFEESGDDLSGLQLARRPEYASVPKIILTAFPDFKSTRGALLPDGEGKTSAINYIAKDEGAAALLEAIRQALIEQAGSNVHLQIQTTEPGRSFLEGMARKIDPDVPSHLLQHRANELYDLLRRLFREHRQIRIGQLLWHGEGRACFSVLAESYRGIVDSRVVVCGERSSVLCEAQLVDDLAPLSTLGQRVPTVAQTARFAALNYALPDDAGSVCTLKELHRMGSESALKAAMENLAGEVLAAWHHRGESSIDVDLMTLYRRQVGLGGAGMDEEAISERMVALAHRTRFLREVDIHLTEGEITFEFRKDEPVQCPDPVWACYRPLSHYIRPVTCRVSPGSLTAERVLVDCRRRPRLTHFATAGQAPEWWDYVCLEAIVRFELGQARDLLGWLGFEGCLVDPASLDEPLHVRDVDEALRSLALRIGEIRTKACAECGPDPLPYYAGLLAWIIGAVAHYEPDRLYFDEEKLRGAHLLLAASLLARRVYQLSNGIQEAHSDLSSASIANKALLRLSRDGIQVSIGERYICDLVGQERDVFGCLYENANETTSREELLDRVFGPVRSGAAVHQDHQLTTIISRLRGRIEPNARAPRYIVTVKGIGYRLETRG
jgi:DNA-binding response OmpR family regulator